MDLRGMKELKARLEAMEKTVARKVTAQALRAGAKIGAAAMVAAAPVKSGATRRSVKVRAIKGRRRGGVVRIAAGVSKKLFTGPRWYQGPLEFGHGIGKRYRARKSDSQAVQAYAKSHNAGRKRVPGKHWIERAFNASAAAAARTIMETIAAGIEKAAAGKSSTGGAA